MQGQKDILNVFQIMIIIQSVLMRMIIFNLMVKENSITCLDYSK